MSVLCLDIGSGTQDVLYYQPGRELMNCPKFILPAPARMIADRISNLASKGRHIHLYGQNMGGGFGAALRRHVEAGLQVSATPRAACSLADNPQRVREKGVQILEKCPVDHSPLYLADFDPGYWQNFLALCGLEYPDLVLAAAQDHGFHPDRSNRQGRFMLWKEILQACQGRLQDLIFEDPPAAMTRLQEIQEAAGNCLVTDTGSAAVLGAMCVPEVRQLSEQRGVCVLNLGNSHAVAFLIYNGLIYGLYEQHTSQITSQGVLHDLYRLRTGQLKQEEVFQAGGHGCQTLNLPLQSGVDFQPLFVLGPRRDLLHGEQVQFPAPGGDMMLAGCYGLLQGYVWKKGQQDIFAAANMQASADTGCACGCK